METEIVDGYLASNGERSPRKEHARMLVDLSISSTPNGQHSPNAHAIKQEEATEEEGEKRSLAVEEAGQSGEEGSGLEEPLIDSPIDLQDGGSGADGAGDGGARLSNVGKPHKCNYCGRSYKQRTSLEEHKERCHNYLQSGNMDSAQNPGPYQGDILKDQKPSMEAMSMAPFDRPPVIERLQGSLGKRKSTTPQKFVGEKMVRYSYPELNYELGMKYEKEAELVQVHLMDQAINNAITYMGAESLRSHLAHPQYPMGDVVPLINPLFPHQVYPLAPRLDRPNSRDAVAPPLPPPDFPPSSNGPISLVRPRHPHPQAPREESPGNSGPDSADSERSSPQEQQQQQQQQQLQQLQQALLHNHHAPYPLTGPAYAKEVGRGAEPAAREGPEAGKARPAVLERPPGRDAPHRVFSKEGREVRAFHCEHCRVLFLDHVMFTIHMGCHGYRDPLQCNICGHRSRDRYEFSSHIVRGEHTFQ
ncbi:zinc finger protein Helios-like isoform X3 [Conger conger]|uniref:zinc finger protein Helios-like isoform X3 n=1 Tax=Conger conger TaxID=82655 RepID=UPI002A598D40|nr:zinc finger protein Helios-like isoform X3 [Conger conger]